MAQAGDITGLSAPAHGAKVTTPEAFTVYLPWPWTTNPDDAEPSVQFGADSPVAQNFTDDTVSVRPVPAVSFDNTLIVCAAPCTPDELSFVAFNANEYKAFTTAFVPTATAATFDRATPDVALVVPVVVPAEPDTTVALETVFVPDVGNPTL